MDHKGKREIKDAAIPGDEGLIIWNNKWRQACFIVFSNNHPLWTSCAARWLLRSTVVHSSMINKLIIEGNQAINSETIKSVENHIIWSPLKLTFKQRSIGG